MPPVSVPAVPEAAGVPRPRPFRAWVTVVATLIIAGFLVVGLMAKRAASADVRSIEPLAVLDSRLRREPLDETLARPVAAEAERVLRAALADPAASLATSRAARARLAVILGEAGRWPEVQPLLAPGEQGTVFPRVVTCAYGPDRGVCESVATCDANRAAALAAYAGDWCAARACVVGATRRGDVAAATRLSDLPPRFPRLRALRTVLDAAALAAGLVAAWTVGRRRRHAGTARPDLPAPWPLGDLYGALVRGVLWSLLAVVLLVAALAAASTAAGSMGEGVGATFYLVGLWSTARLVFRRWGLSWRDSLGWPARREIGLTMLAAIGLQRAGQLGLGLAASALQHRAPWSDLPAPLDSMGGGRLIVALLEIVVLAPLVEELVFRRTILARLARARSAPFAIVASTILFTLSHGYSPLGLASIFWSGLVFGWAFHRTSNLWPGVATHAWGNAMALWYTLS